MSARVCHGFANCTGLHWERDPDVIPKDGMIHITRAPRGASRFLIAASCIFIFLASLHAQPTPALKLIPMPREVQAGSILSLDHGFLIPTASRDAEDHFTAEDLRATLKEPAVPSRATGLVIELLRTNTASARALLAASHITFESAMHDEGYLIVNAGPTISPSLARRHLASSMARRQSSSSSPGRGAQPSSIPPPSATGPPSSTAASTTISPAAPSPRSTSRRVIRTLAAYKVNVYSPYFEHTLQSTPSPLMAPRAAPSPRPIPPSSSFAAQYHIDHHPRSRKRSATSTTPSTASTTPHSPRPLMATSSRRASRDRWRSSSRWFAEIDTIPSRASSSTSVPDETFELGTWPDRRAHRALLTASARCTWAS